MSYTNRPTSHTNDASVVQWLGFHPSMLLGACKESSQVEVRVRFTAVAKPKRRNSFNFLLLWGALAVYILVCRHVNFFWSSENWLWTDDYCTYLAFGADKKLNYKIRLAWWVFWGLRSLDKALSLSLSLCLT
jgi:hypothetical protein